jgi:pimeloyl-ACP methyl ester carboxylesterase
MMRETHTQLEFASKRVRGTVRVDGETVGYTLYEVDARAENQRADNVRNKQLDGNLNVYIPGHGQRATAARNAMATIAALSSSRILWSIDIDPPVGGDPTRAEALVKIIRSKASERFFDIERQELAESPSFKVTIFGWSHGAAEAMRAAEKDPDLFQHMVGLCPTGLIERSPCELVWSFIIESLRVLWDALIRLDWTLTRVLAIGYDIIAGIICDLLRSRPLQRVVDDIRWASRKVTGKDYSYSGIVVILFGEKDTVIRWQDVFPECQDPGNIGQFLDEYKKHNFPMVRRLEVQVLEGNHIASETKAPLYIKTAFDLVD